MGISQHITADTYPPQTRHLNSIVRVIFHYDTSRQFTGVFVRHDAAEPYRGIIRLDDGRYVMDTECQWQDIQ